MRLYVISSPLQLLNAIEARECFKHSGSDVLIYIYRKPADLDQLSGILDDQWTGIRYFKLSAIKRLFYPMMLRSFLSKKPIDRIYLGYPYNIRAHIANAFHAETWILDDGTFTLRLNEDLLKTDSAYWKSSSIADRLLGRLVDLSYLKTVSFFTCYDIAPPHGQKVIHNDYHAIKKQISKQILDEEVLFIGSPIEGIMLPSNGKFISLMKQVSEFYGKRKIIYALHRLEDEKIRKAQLEQMGITVKKFKTPLEAACYQENITPFEVASFLSSALSNLHQIYGFNARAFRLPESDFDLKNQQAVSNLYNDLDKRKIPMTILNIHEG